MISIKNGQHQTQVASPTLEPATPTPDDSVLILETLDGNSDSFGQLVTKYQKRFLPMALRILGNQAEAEDVLQDSFVDAYRHLAEFQNRSKFSTWLYTIVLNHIRNRLRHNRVIRYVSIENSDPDDTDRWMPEIAERGLAFDVALEQKFQLEDIQAAVARFPLPYRAIFVMHYFQDLPLKEISERLGRPLGTIKAYLHRARKLLNNRPMEKALTEPLEEGELENELAGDPFVSKELQEQES